MDTISITEALVAELVERENVDATNAIALLRTASANIRAERPGIDLNAQRPIDDVDDITISVSRNGHRDIFSSEPERRHVPNVVRSEDDLVIDTIGDVQIRWANQHDTSPVILAQMVDGFPQMFEPGPMRGNWPTPEAARAFVAEITR